MTCWPVSSLKCDKFVHEYCADKMFKVVENNEDQDEVNMDAS